MSIPIKETAVFNWVFRMKEAYFYEVRLRTNTSDVQYLTAFPTGKTSNILFTESKDFFCKYHLTYL